MNKDYLFHEFLIPQSYSALPEYLKPNIEPSRELNPPPDDEWIPVGPFIVAPEILAKFGSEKDYPKTPELPAYGKGKYEGSCPLLPQSLIPKDELGSVANFVQGPVLYKGSEADRIPPAMGERYVEIQRGTLIFTPNAEGRYDNFSSGNHVAVFLSYKPYRNVEGIFVIDQYLNRKTNGKRTAGIRHIPKGTGAIDFRSNDARAFAVVYALRQVKWKIPKIKPRSLGKPAALGRT